MVFDLSNIENLSSYTLGIGASISLNVSFNPTEAKSYECQIELFTDNKLLQPVIIDLTGIGTLPTIETYNNRIDNTIIYHSTNAVFRYIKIRW